MMGFYLLEHSSVNGTQWQQWTYPRRGASLSGTCIIHTAESVLDNVGPDAGAEDCAAFIARRTGSYGSYHTLVDSDSIIELAPYEYETWQDSETNNWAVGISAACRTTDWNTMGEAKREGYYRNLAWAAADFVTYMKTKGIEVPIKRISGADARTRKPGFAAHGDSGIARSDPGKDFDWDRFFRYIKEELDGKVEDTLSANSQFVSKDGIPVTLNELLNSLDKKVQVLENVDLALFIHDVRVEIAVLKELLIADKNLTKEELLETIKQAVLKVEISTGDK